MNPIEEECIRRLSTLNETAPSIEGMSKWMQSNYMNAYAIMRIWKEQFSELPYNTKLYLFYVANNILVQERSMNRFVYTPLLNDILPMMTSVSFENVLNQDVAKRILHTIHIWHDNHTVGRTMTNSILISIPESIFTMYPEYADLNIHPDKPEQPEDIDYYSNSSPEYPDIAPTKLDEEERIPPEKIPMLREECSKQIQEILDIWQNDYLISEQSREQRKELRLRKVDLEVMLKDYSSMRGESYKDVEMQVSKRGIQSLCFDILHICENEIDGLKRIDSLIDDYVELCQSKQEDDNSYIEKATEYGDVISANRSILNRESRKRRLSPINNEFYKRNTSYY